MGNSSEKHQHCYFDMQVGSNPIKRLVFELYFKDCPKTAFNFRALCTGEKSTDKEKLCFAGSNFHRCVKGYMAQGGDITRGDGTGGKSIYGKEFKDENFKYKHDKRGVLSMANTGKNSNGSQFFITFAPQPYLDGKHVVFGHVVDGFDCLDEIESVSNEVGDTLFTQNIQIIRCGVL